MSKDPITAPKFTGRNIILPFHPGCRYAAIPGKSVNNQNVEVDLHDVRPYSIIYYDHVLHLADLGHTIYMKLGQIPFQVNETIQY